MVRLSIRLRVRHKAQTPSAPASSRVAAPRQLIPRITKGLGFLGYPPPSRHPAWSPTPIQHRAETSLRSTGVWESLDGLLRSVCPVSVTVEPVLSEAEGTTLYAAPLVSSGNHVP